MWHWRNAKFYYVTVRLGKLKLNIKYTFKYILKKLNIKYIFKFNSAATGLATMVWSCLNLAGRCLFQKLYWTAKQLKAVCTCIFCWDCLTMRQCSLMSITKSISLCSRSPQSSGSRPLTHDATACLFHIWHKSFCRQMYSVLDSSLPAIMMPDCMVSFKPAEL